MTVSPRVEVSLARKISPWWSPWGFLARLVRVVRSPWDVVWLVRVGWFIARLPTKVERSHLSDLLAWLSEAPRPRSEDPIAATERIVRLRTPWLRLPLLRGHDTCYVRALTLYRFLDAAGHDARLRIGAEWFDQPGGVLRGHAWVELDGAILEGPPEADAHDSLQMIELHAR